MRRASVFFPLSLALSFLAAAAFSAGAAGDKVKVGLCMANLEPFLSSLADAAVQRASESGMDLVLMDAQDDAEKQIEQVGIMLDDGVDVLVLNPSSTSRAARIVAAAAEKNVPIVWVNKDPFSGGAVPPGNHVIVSDNLREGELCMEYVGEALAGKGGIVILRGTPGHAAAEGRNSGVMKVLGAHYPGIKVLAAEPANWSRERGADVMRRFVSTHGDAIDAVLSGNDEMALGALHVLKASGMDGVPVCGVDGTRDGIESVASAGGMAATVYQDPFAQGAGGMDLAGRIARGEEVAERTTIPVRLITRANVKEFKRWLRTR